MFPASQRGLAMSVFAAAPFLGPTLGENKSPPALVFPDTYS
jgi:hypothetical protein